MRGPAIPTATDELQCLREGGVLDCGAREGRNGQVWDEGGRRAKNRALCFGSKTDGISR